MPGDNDTVSNRDGNSSALMDAVAERLERQGRGAVTSTASRLQSEIAGAIQQTERSGNLNAAALESARQREVSFAQDRGAAQFSEALESRRGFATPVAAFRELTDTTEKSIRDLDQRYRELILQNDSATAQRVADLQVKKLEFMQEQEQQLFSNLIAAAGLEEQRLGREQQASQFERGLSAEDERLERKLGFDLSMFDKQVASDERNMILGLAAENGIPVNDNETIESMIAKVSPFVDERRKLELEKVRTDIQRNRAEVARALNSGVGNALLDKPIVDAFALAIANGTAEAELSESAIQTTEQAAQVAARVQEFVQLKEDRLSEIASSPVITSPQDFARAVAADPVIPLNVSKADLERYANLNASKWTNNAINTSRNSRVTGTSFNATQEALRSRFGGGPTLSERMRESNQNN